LECKRRHVKVSDEFAPDGGCHCGWDIALAETAFTELEHPTIRDIGSDGIPSVTKVFQNALCAGNENWTAIILHQMKMRITAQWHLPLARMNRKAAP
jgi:hypothetical protein